MEKIQIEKTIKKFAELNDEQQDIVLNNLRFINVEYDDWNEYLIDKFLEDLKEKTGLELKSNDLTWAVGDRNAHFGVLSREVITQLTNKYAEKGVYDIETPNKLGSFLNHMGGGICNQNSTERGMAEVYFEEDTTEYAEKNKEVRNTINDEIDTIIDLCVDYHNRNEEAYNYALSDEAVKDTIECNEYDFDEENLEIFGGTLN